MEIKPCPFCGNENLAVKGNNTRFVHCERCGTYGPDAKSDEEAVRFWNCAPRKEDMKMEKCCKNCVHISEEIDGKVYCCKKIDINHSCKYWEALNPFGISRSTCLVCKHRYYSWGGDNICNYCGHEIGNPEGYVCDSWEAKASISTPLNTSNLRGLEPFFEADEGDMDVIQVIEPMVNRYQMAAEEAAELAQALLKYCRACGHGSWTPINPKDATDAVIEEYADLLLVMEASFARCEGNKMFYNNLERVYREKAKRWAERLKERGEE